MSERLAFAAILAILAPAAAVAASGDSIGDLLSRGGDFPTQSIERPQRIEAAPLGATAAEPATLAPFSAQGVQRSTAPRRAAAVPMDGGEPPDGYPVDLLITLANDAVFTPDPYPKGRRSDPRMIKLQVLLDRNAASPGVIDGMFGDNVVKGVMAYEEMVGHPVDGIIDAALWASLEQASTEPVLTPYVITPEDVAGPFVPTMPADYAEQAALPGLSYRDAAEMLAERFHMDEAFLRRINPGVTFAEAGAEIMVTNVGKPLKARLARIIADKARKQLRGYDASGRLAVAYPATIGSSELPSPTGLHAVKAIAIDPEYWYRPKVNFVQGANTKALRLPPGPNGPVGATWVGLDKPTYGLHGTPEPSKIDKTNSHGCVRLTNWDARELAGLVVPGVPVDFQEPPAAADAPAADTPMAEQQPADVPDAQAAEPATLPETPHGAPERRVPPLRDRRAEAR